MVSTTPASFCMVKVIFIVLALSIQGLRRRTTMQSSVHRCRQSINPGIMEFKTYNKRSAAELMIFHSSLDKCDAETSTR